MELLLIPEAVNEGLLTLERINEINLTDNFKNIIYHTSLMNELNEYEESKVRFKNIMRSITNEGEILLININFRNIIISKINEFITRRIFEFDNEFMELKEEINRILISITL